jgi:hypothetical protein
MILNLRVTKWGEDWMNSDLDRMALIMNELLMTRQELMPIAAKAERLTQQLNVITGDSNEQTSNSDEREETDSRGVGTGATSAEY